MNNKKSNPLIVEKNNFNINFIKNLGTTKYLKIVGDYKLTKKDYDNLVIYSNVEFVDVKEIEQNIIENEIKINSNKQIEFKSGQFKKINIDIIEGYKKEILTLTLPFKITFENDYLCSEEDEFQKLLKYVNNIEMININLETPDTIDKAIEVIYKIENKINKKIKFINCITKNRTINAIEKLKFLEDERIIKIWYEDGITDCTIDEFIIMRKSIDSIINKIKEKKLSNFEKVIYVYDIVKKYNYNSSKNNYSMDGRQLHKIFTTKNIVCSGYARIISQVLNELGIRAGLYKLITKNNELHARNIVHIIDEKYDINYIYSMEPTWESALKEDYAYSMFLTPIDKLKEYFPKEKFRQDIDVLNGTKNIEEINLRDRISLYQFFENTDITQKEINQIISQANKKVTLNKFCNALSNIKETEGISKNNFVTTVPQIINYNNTLINYLNEKMETNINFFEERGSI